MKRYEQICIALHFVTTFHFTPHPQLGHSPVPFSPTPSEGQAASDLPDQDYDDIDYTSGGLVTFHTSLSR